MALTKPFPVEQSLFQDPPFAGRVRHVALLRRGLKLEPAFDTLFFCLQAMKESRLNWPLITEEELERQLLYTTATAAFRPTASWSFSLCYGRRLSHQHPRSRQQRHRQRHSTNQKIK
jgi:hypothetical protein